MLGPMSKAAIFEVTSMAFALSTASQTGAAVIRVRFSGAMPLSASPLGTRDATNAGNWRLIGPASVEVAEVRPVGSDPFSFDLVCDGVLVVGAWVLEAQQIQTAKGEALTTTSISFMAVGAQPFFSVPSQQVTSEEVLRRNLNAALAGPGWRAFIAALGYSDEKVAKAAESAFYQRLLATASGIYLERLAGQKGLDKPPNVKMSDDVLRQLAIAISRDRTNAVAIEAVLLAYYGLDATVAHAVSSAASPWALVDGDELRFHVDDADVDVVFQEADFSVISQATPTEVVAVINRQLRRQGLRAAAMASPDPETGNVSLAIYSGFSGIKGRLKFYGGGAQRAFGFPETVATTQAAGTQWTVAPSTALNGIPPGRTRFTWTGGTDPSPEVVFTGDYVTVYGSVFQAANRGVFRIVETTPTWFEIEGLDDGVAQTATQTATSDIFWTRPLAINLTGAYKAAVVNTGPGQAEILLPTTATAVERGLNTAWYLNGLQSIALDSGFSGGRTGNLVTIRTTTPHGLTVGRRFTLDEVEIDYETSATAQVSVGTTPSQEKCWSATKMADGRIMAIFESATVPMPDTTVNAWIFDPATNSWSSPILLPLGSASDYPPAIVGMTDGRVLAVDTHEWSVYDPETGVWTTAINLAYPSTVPPYFSLVSLPNGTVMSVYAADAADELWAAIFAPLFGFWNVPVTVDSGRLPYCRATLCESTGDVIVAGGLDGGSPSDRAYIWRTGGNVGLGDWYSLDPMPAVHAYPSGTYVASGPAGAIWVAGPHMGDEASHTISILDLTTLTWSSKSVGVTVSDDTMQALVNDANRIFWVPVAADFGWQWHNPWAPAGVNTFTIADTEGPGVDGDNFLFAFPVSGGRIWAVTQDPTVAGTTVELLAFSSYRQLSAGRLAGGPWTVNSVIDDTILTFLTPDSGYTKVIGGQLTPIRAEDGDIRSGYILNPKDGLAVADAETVLTVAVDGGPVISVLTVASLDGFNDEPGWLCLSYGTAEQTGVIRYLGTSGSNGIRLDPSTTLPRDYGAGTVVTRLDSAGPWGPEDSTKLGVSWLTDSSVGRIEAQKDLVDVIAEGVGIVNTVLYPGDRGLGNEGRPKTGATKLSDAVTVWGGDDYLDEAAAAREED